MTASHAAAEWNQCAAVAAMQDGFQKSKSIHKKRGKWAVLLLPI
jgi:hypothetical protein